MSYSVLRETLADFKPPKPTYLPKDYPDLTDKVVFITGTSTGIGYETTKLLLKQNATVVIFNRNKDKTDLAINNIKREIVEDNQNNFNDIKDLDSKIISIIGDLSDLSTITPSINSFKISNPQIKQLDLIILNAGVMQPPNGSKTIQGYELQFGTNVLGHQLVIKNINDLILNSANLGNYPRVIWLSSIAHAMSPQTSGLSWDFNNANHSNSMEIYGQSKAANIYQAYIYGQLFKDQNIISVAVHPGYLKSELQRSYNFINRWISSSLLYHPIYGSYTELYAGLSKDITLENNGDYYGPWGRPRLLRPDIDKGRNDGTAKKLWDWVENELKPYL
ncbi:hypothetical protein WICMUC_001658 [Wickerhamomyces mucosus]|uniref:NAD(P)-binding protein n=1 Tax=Wickerhamomyces mucosus TaxID=1378264 RepID=A0A9P8PU21_9ASCO|nr:hypothetical protein WICMUC_001658 [Wickerhamomyces mucosus]